MSVWRPIDDKAKDGGLYAVWFREPPSENFPNGYGYWLPRVRRVKGRWTSLSDKGVFDMFDNVPVGHVATHYADMSPPESYSL